MTGEKEKLKQIRVDRAQCSTLTVTISSRTVIIAGCSEAARGYAPFTDCLRSVRIFFTSVQTIWYTPLSQEFTHSHRQT